MRRSATTFVAVMLLLVGSTSAQWLKLPAAGAPRTPDGKPDLTAPTPRAASGRPDLSGIWQRPRSALARAGLAALNMATGTEVLLQPWAEALYKARIDNNSKGMPSERCLPHGITKAVSVPEPFKIVQTPGVTVILHEEFNHYRQIFTDGRGMPERRKPTFFGYSIGQWEGDALVVNTRGFLNDTWLDVPGHPATDALHLVERYRRLDFGHLEIQFTIDDPKAYLKPWRTTWSFELLPDTELIEHFCENEKDAPHLVGR